jgi:hypothetical protein
MRLYISAVIVSALTIAGSPAVLGAQSLADVARKEQERRKNVKPGGKVLTNKDLGTDATPPSAPPVEAAKPADPTAKPAEPPKPEEPVKDQAYWSGRMKELRTLLDRDMTFAEALQSRINALSADFVNRDDPAQRGVIERDRQRAVSELARVTKSIEDGKIAIANLEEEARKAGAPPGWLR